MRSNLLWLSDKQWQRIEPLLPTDVRGKDRVDDRRVISGILHVLKSGGRWCDCPPKYGPPTTIYNRFGLVREADDRLQRSSAYTCFQPSCGNGAKRRWFRVAHLSHH
jgi:transposase